jgi:predicted negative regulator of RcsB-dependent stress response
MALGILIAFGFFAVLGMFMWGAYQNNQDPNSQKSATKLILLITLIMVAAITLTAIFDR